MFSPAKQIIFYFMSAKTKSIPFVLCADFADLTLLNFPIHVCIISLSICTFALG